MIVKTDTGFLSLKSSPFAGAHGRTSVWRSSGNVQLVGMDLYATYAGLYRTQPWLSSVVNKLSRAIARLPLKNYQRAIGGDKTRISDEGLDGVLQAPFSQGSRFRLIEWTVADAALYGNALWVPVSKGPGRPPHELWPAPWPRIEVVGEDRPRGYVYHGPKGPIPFDVDEVVHFRFWGPSPSGDLVGLSPVEPLRRTLINEDAAARWSTSLFQNSGRPSGVVSTDKAIGNERDRGIIRQELQELYGGVDQAFRIAVLDKGLQWQPLAFSATDSGLIELRKLNREECCAAYDIPPPMIHILDRATFSNVSEQHWMFYMDSLGPWVTMLEETVLTQLIARHEVWRRQFVEFDFDEVLRGNIKERADAYRVFRSFMKMDEMRRLENLDPLGGALGEMILVPAAEIPLSMAGEQYRNKGPAAKALDVISTALDRVERSAASRVGAGKEHGLSAETFLKQLLADLGPEATINEAVVQWATGLAKRLETELNDATNPQDIKAAVQRARSLLPFFGGGDGA